jgi:hypothetical protein
VTRPVAGPRDPAPVRLAQVRAHTRHLIGDEARALADQWSYRGHDARRSMLLAYLTGYLGAYCEQVDRDPTIPAREVAAVVQGVLDAVEAESRPRETS